MRSPSTLYSAFIARERGMVLDIHSFFICGSIGSKILVPTSGYSGKWMRWRWVEGWNRVIADERKIEQLIYNLYIKVHIISPFIYVYKYYKKWSFFISHHIYHIRSLHFNHTPVEPAFTAIPIPTTPQPNTQFRDKKKEERKKSGVSCTLTRYIDRRARAVRSARPQDLRGGKWGGDRSERERKIVCRWNCTLARREKSTSVVVVGLLENYLPEKKRERDRGGYIWCALEPSFCKARNLFSRGRGFLFCFVWILYSK